MLEIRIEHETLKTAEGAGVYGKRSFTSVARGF